MYQVITMYGDNEPWWFFEDWREDIIEERKFDCLDEAATYYLQKWQEISSEYTYTNAKPNYLSAFWNDGDERWCDECDEDLQQYKGLALLQNDEQVSFESVKDLYVTANECAKPRCCKSNLVSQ
ncbi:DUF1033 family protein [Enterococcus sp. BWR-S5]|uniref:DUF1033 family protein n=1 Tax=Enterococcus sp. BWR-S5 TaxID=2787714 RepID=UPI001922BC94|nr:DUF1033 family protein [uncultured Enterococcus sp.]MBL1223940.1 DUF1033 family protein [Enterococcus sp. BWR-S5]